MKKDANRNFWTTPLARSAIRGETVRLPEMLLGYLVGPFGALLSSGIFTSMLQNYFTDVLKLDLSFLTTLQLLLNTAEENTASVAAGFLGLMAVEWLLYFAMRAFRRTGYETEIIAFSFPPWALRWWRPPMPAN